MADADAVNRKLWSAEDAVVQAVAAAMQGVGEIVQVAAQISITENSISGKHHVPSAPGHAPNQDTGVLANGIEVTQPEPLKVVITSTAPYSAALELGTSKMSPRPFMEPALIEKEDEVRQTLAAVVANAIRKNFGAS